MAGQTLKNKKIALVIAFSDFRDEEYVIPRSVFESEGAEVVAVSAKKGKAIGSYGGVVQVDLLLDDLRVGDFDALVFVGGSGAAAYFENEKCRQLAQEAVKQNKVLGAICIAPAILAKSGVLQNRKATVWSSQLDKSAVKILKEGGADYIESAVVVDEKIITANGPQSAAKFAQSIVQALS